MQKIFLVDDSLPVRERLVQMIAALPHSQLVGAAGGVREAIAGILATRPDVVLLDISLEHGSGFDVLREVHEREPGIDIYMLSNFSAEPYRRHAERLGARGFFDKSDFDKLRVVLKGETSCQPSSH